MGIRVRGRRETGWRKEGEIGGERKEGRQIHKARPAYPKEMAEGEGEGINCILLES